MDRIEISSFFASKRYYACLEEVNEKCVIVVDSKDVALIEQVSKECFIVLQFLKLEKAHDINANIYKKISKEVTKDLEKIKKAYVRSGGTLDYLAHGLLKLDITGFDVKEDYRDYITFLEMISGQIATDIEFMDRLQQGFNTKDYSSAFSWLDKEIMQNTAGRYLKNLMFVKSFLRLCTVFIEGTGTIFSIPEHDLGIIKKYIDHEEKVRISQLQMDKIERYVVFDYLSSRPSEYIKEDAKVSIRRSKDCTGKVTGIEYSFKILADSEEIVYHPLKRRFLGASDLTLSDKIAIFKDIELLQQENHKWVASRQHALLQEYFTNVIQNLPSYDGVDTDYEFYSTHPRTGRTFVVSLSRLYDDRDGKQYFKIEMLHSQDNVCERLLMLHSQDNVCERLLEIKIKDNILNYNCINLELQYQALDELRKYFDNLKGTSLQEKELMEASKHAQDLYMNAECGWIFLFDENPHQSLSIGPYEVTLKKANQTEFVCTFFEDKKMVIYDVLNDKFHFGKSISTVIQTELIHAINRLQKELLISIRKRVLGILEFIMHQNNSDTKYLLPETMYSVTLHKMDNGNIEMRIHDGGRSTSPAAIIFSTESRAYLKVIDRRYNDEKFLNLAERLIQEMFIMKKRTAAAQKLLGYIGSLEEESVIRSQAVQARAETVHHTTSISAYAFEKVSKDAVSFSCKGVLRAYLPSALRPSIEMFEDIELKRPIKGKAKRRNTISQIRDCAPFYNHVSNNAGGIYVFNQQSVLLSVLPLELLGFYTKMLRANDQSKITGKHLFGRIEDLQSPAEDASAVTQEFFTVALPKCIDALLALPEGPEKKLGADQLGYLFSKMYRVYLTPYLPILDVIHSLSDYEIGLAIDNAKAPDTALSMAYFYNEIIECSKDETRTKDQRIEDIKEKFTQVFKEDEEVIQEQLEIITDQLEDEDGSIEFEDADDLVSYLDKSEDNYQSFIQACEELLQKAVSSDKGTKERYLARQIAKSMVENDMSFVNKIRAPEFSSILGAKFDVQRASRMFSLYAKLFSGEVQAKLNQIAKWIEIGNSMFIDGTKGLNEVEAKAFIQFVTGSTNVALTNKQMDEIEQRIDAREDIQEIYADCINTRHDTLKIIVKDQSSFQALTCFKALYLGNGAMSAADLRAAIEVCIEGKGFTHA